MFRCLILAVAGWVALPAAAPAQTPAPPPPSSSWLPSPWPGLVVRFLREPVLMETVLETILDRVGSVTYQPAKVSVFVELPKATGKMEVLKFEGHVVLEGKDESWWGDNHVKLRVPCEFRFDLDLKAIQAKDVSFDTQKNLVKVKLPPVTQCRPTFQLSGVEVLAKSNPMFRSRASWLELKERLLSENLEDRARAIGDTKISEAHLTGRALMQDFLRRTYAPVQPGVAVVVE